MSFLIIKPWVFNHNKDMKKFLFFVVLIEFLVFLGVFVFVQLNYYSFENSWFYYILLFIAVCEYSRAFYLNLDSSLFLGSILFFVGWTGIVKDILNIPFSYIYPLYIFAFAFASFMNYTFFRQNIHLKIFAIISVLVIILILYKLNILSFITTIILLSAYLLFLIIVIRFVWRKNQRRT